VVVGALLPLKLTIYGGIETSVLLLLFFEYPQEVKIPGVKNKLEWLLLLLLLLLLCSV